MKAKRRQWRAPQIFPEIPGFDLNAGPEGLDEPDRMRRARRLGSARWSVPEEELPEYLKGEKLDREILKDLTFSGNFSARSGEDLPALRPLQVQLAGFCYTRTIHCECWSLGKLIWMIDNCDQVSGNSGLYFPHLMWAVSEYEETPESMIGYLSVHSEFYPELEDWYDQAARAWVEEIKAGADVRSIRCPSKHRIKC